MNGRLAEKLSGSRCVTSTCIRMNKITVSVFAFIPDISNEVPEFAVLTVEVNWIELFGTEADRKN